MSTQHEDLLLNNDEDQPPLAWWSQSSLLTPEVTSIIASRRLPLPLSSLPT